MKRVIPITPIWRRYRALRDAKQHERLAAAQRLVDRPNELATEFAESVARFASYANHEDHFYPQRPVREFADEIKRTNDLILRLEARKQFVPADAPNRVTEHAAGPAVTAVPAHRLACDYVDRELLVQRTTSPATWEDGSRNIGGLRLDVLLADAADRTPIIGELKLPGDMDPFFALVQALACAAHLATPHQYERMRRHLQRGGHSAQSLESARESIRIPITNGRPFGRGDRNNFALQHYVRRVGTYGSTTICTGRWASNGSAVGAGGGMRGGGRPPGPKGAVCLPAVPGGGNLRAPLPERGGMEDGPQVARDRVASTLARGDPHRCLSIFQARRTRPVDRRRSLPSARDVQR